MLHGFPNQINTFSKVAKAVKVFRHAQHIQLNLKSDSSIGELLLKEEIIGYRDKKLTIEEYLQKQREKKASNRSYEASARGIRELLVHLKFLEHKNGQYFCTEYINFELFDFKKNLVSDVHKKNWKKILSNISLGEFGFHPYKVLLKLVEKNPGLNRKFSCLCLETIDDSEEELSRVCDLIKKAEEIYKNHSKKRKLEEIIAELVNDSPNNINNAIKILPSFAEQAGDIVIEKNNKLFLKEKNHQTTNKESAKLFLKNQKKSSRKVSANEIANAGTLYNEGDIDYVIMDENHAENMRETLSLRADRLKRHNIIVKIIAKILENKGFTLYESPYDCLARRENDAIIFEVKSLNGYMGDEVSQVRAALAQLKYYEEFSDLQGAKKVTLVAVFEVKISEEHENWLSKHGIKCHTHNDLDEMFAN
ncbi:hypothetical protein [Shewanella scandinavica]|uniref:Protein NO VEIN C-terminal domain-containing protein n=1 Tax=Shewanella scandinavica TaxID=3063538 RepID=A0ABU3FX47_9GAMM|nr:hypothetical protein [Shewanella sp. SP2S1-2]MDT3279662.1 hypothetical protein [Shewanella sp. SP2S1-2]